MKIVFWSPERGKCATTSSMLAVASHTALTSGLDCCIFSVDCKDKIQSAFLTKADEDILLQSASSFGMDALLRDVRGSLLSDESIEDASLALSNKLSLFISSTNKDVKMVQKALEDCYSDLVEPLDKKYQLMFINTAGGYSIFNQRILASADLLVVCLNQSKQVLDDVFNLCDFSTQNCLFMMNNYDRDIALSLKNVQRTYKDVTAKNSVAIRHFAAYADAINKGTVFKWFASIKKCTRKDASYGFHKDVEAASVKLLNLLKIGGTNDSL